jgi:hypothetical protein
VLNRPEEEREMVPKWIKDRQPISVDLLVDEDHPMSEIELEVEID